jgi:DNA mismatch repair protein MutS
MQIDQQTQRDLELRSTSSSPGLIDHLDRTRTRGGRDVLVRRLTRPLHSAAAIQQVQDTLRYIADNVEPYSALRDGQRLVALQRYLDSRYTTLTSVQGAAADVESLWIWLRYRDLYCEVQRGTQILREFLMLLETFAGQVPDAPQPLGGYVAELLSILRAPSVRRLCAARPHLSARDTLLRDHLARGPARACLLRLLELVFEIDALVAMSDVTREKGYTFPVVGDEDIGIALQGVYHPFLEAPISNELQLSDHKRLLYITGPNMAGKTTYLKACGVALLLAHTGMGVPARVGRVSVLDRLITGIRTEDSLRDGVSYFQAEARRVREMTRALEEGQRCLIIVDELFRGTNIKDACDASLVVLHTFARALGGRFLVASHLIELAEELQQVPGVSLARFEATLTDGDLAFDYQLEAGVSSQRLGMLVLEKEGVLQALKVIREHASV